MTTALSRTGIACLMATIGACAASAPAVAAVTPSDPPVLVGTMPAPPTADDASSDDLLLGTYSADGVDCLRLARDDEGDIVLSMLVINENTPGKNRCELAGGLVTTLGPDGFVADVGIDDDHCVVRATIHSVSVTVVSDDPPGCSDRHCGAGVSLLDRTFPLTPQAAFVECPPSE